LLVFDQKTKIVETVNMANDNDVFEQILAAAQQVFKKWGFRKTTMEDIAREAGKGKATLYYYFKSKDEVFNAVIKRETDDILRIATKAIGTVDTAAGKLKTFFVTYYNEVRNMKNMYNAIIMEIREDNGIIGTQLRKFDYMGTELLRNIVRAGIENGEFVPHSDEELETQTYIISTMLRSALFEFVVEQDVPEEGRRVTLVADLLIRGISG